MPRRFAISDIHGCVATFETLLRRIDLQAGDELFLLGDFIDRGPDSKAVIDRVWALSEEGLKVQCLRGNHEQMLLDATSTKDRREMFLFNGGSKTLESFGVGRVSDVPKPYREWMDALPLYLESPGYLMVHAGIDFRSEAPLEDDAALLWLRDWYHRIDRDWLAGRIVIHGHTPTAAKLLRRQVEFLEHVPALNIDAGCVFATRGLGYLCAFDLDARRHYFEPNLDRRRKG